MQKNNFEGEESCIDWEGTEKHHRKLKKDEENTPEEDIPAKDRVFYPKNQLLQIDPLTIVGCSW